MPWIVNAFKESLLSIAINCPKVTSQVWLLPSLAIIGLHQCAFTRAIDSLLQTCLHNRQWHYLDHLMNWLWIKRYSPTSIFSPSLSMACTWVSRSRFILLSVNTDGNPPRARAHMHPRLAAARWPASKQNESVLDDNTNPSIWQSSNQLELSYNLSLHICYSTAFHSFPLICCLAHVLWKKYMAPTNGLKFGPEIFLSTWQLTGSWLEWSQKSITQAPILRFGL